MRATCLLLTGLLAGAAAPIPVRQPLGTLPIAPGKTVDRVVMNRVAFARPGNAAP